ncbi:MAG: hypothetical protein H6Q85_52 [candidate division NC10 bacterium]|nr:hypothetical protein [candidate division NC10 bacterium]
MVEPCGKRFPKRVGRENVNHFGRGAAGHTPNKKYAHEQSDVDQVLYEDDERKARKGEGALRKGRGFGKSGMLGAVERNDGDRNDAMTIDAATQEEINRLYEAVDEFAAEMKARLREQAMKGYRGWDDQENYQRILEMMMQHAAAAEGEEVDAANLAMILWSLRRRRDGE